MNSSALSSRGCVPRSCSPEGAGARLRACCSMRPRSSIRSTTRWRARPISRRSRRRSSSDASAEDSTCDRRLRPLGPRRRPAATAAHGLAPRRGGGPVHRGLRRGRVAAPASIGRALARQWTQRGRHHGLALAGVPRGTRTHRPRAVGRRDLGGAGRACSRARSRCRCACRSPRRAQLPRRGARARRRVCGRGGADRGSRCDHCGDWQRTSPVHRVDARCLAWRGGPDA